MEFYSIFLKTSYCLTWAKSKFSRGQLMDVGRTWNELCKCDMRKLPWRPAGLSEVRATNQNFQAYMWGIHVQMISAQFSGFLLPSHHDQIYSTSLPLVRFYVITSKWEENGNNESLEHSNWTICSLFSHICSRIFPTFSLCTGDPNLINSEG